MLQGIGGGGGFQGVALRCSVVGDGNRGNRCVTPHRLRDADGFVGDGCGQLAEVVLRAGGGGVERLRGDGGHFGQVRDVLAVLAVAGVLPHEADVALRVQSRDGDGGGGELFPGVVVSGAGIVHDVDAQLGQGVGEDEIAFTVHVLGVCQATHIVADEQVAGGEVVGRGAVLVGLHGPGEAGGGGEVVAGAVRRGGVLARAVGIEVEGREVVVPVDGGRGGAIGGVGVVVAVDVQAA